MKLKIYLVLLIIPLLLVVLGCEKKDAPISALDQEAAVEDNGEEIITTTPEKMLALGKSFQCTFSYEMEKGVIRTGQFYVDGTNRKFRTETMSKEYDPTKELKAFMIFDNETVFSWVDNKNYPAMKMRINTDLGTDTDASEAAQAELEEKVEYHCQKWNVDASKFTPPSDIQFIEFQNYQ